MEMGNSYGTPKGDDAVLWGTGLLNLPAVGGLALSVGFGGGTTLWTGWPLAMLEAGANGVAFHNTLLGGAMTYLAARSPLIATTFERLSMWDKASALFVVNSAGHRTTAFVNGTASKMSTLIRVETPVAKAHGKEIVRQSVK
jgi:hypothetical protein